MRTTYNTRKTKTIINEKIRTKTINIICSNIIKKITICFTILKQFRKKGVMTAMRIKIEHYSEDTKNGFNFNTITPLSGTSLRNVVVNGSP